MVERTRNSRLWMNLRRILYRCALTVGAMRPLLRLLWPATQMQVGGHMYLLHPADNSTEEFMWRRRTRKEIASIGRLTLLVAEKRALVFDVGANCGAFTLPLATAAGAGSHIVAFEPNPEMAKRLRANLALNGLTDRVEVAEVALGEKNGEAALNLVSDNLGQSSLRVNRVAESISVTVLPLAHFVPDQSCRYDVFVMKIDVEGFEDEVLVPYLSAIPTNRMPHAILVETLHCDSWRLDLKDVLRQRGYVALFDGEEGNTLFMRIIDGANHDD